MKDAVEFLQVVQVFLQPIGVKKLMKTRSRFIPDFHRTVLFLIVPAVIYIVDKLLHGGIEHVQQFHVAVQPFEQAEVAVPIRRKKFF